MFSLDNIVAGYAETTGRDTTLTLTCDSGGQSDSDVDTIQLLATKLN